MHSNLNVKIFYSKDEAACGLAAYRFGNTPWLILA